MPGRTWLYSFRAFQLARTTIGRRVRHNNEHRPHQALNYRSSAQFRGQQQLRVA